jgi:hypothetical protein
MPDGIGKSVWLLRRFGCLLQLAQLAPASILLHLCGVGVFFTLQPETEPIYIALLGCHSLKWFLKDMLSVKEINQVNGFPLFPQRRINLPLRQ